MSAVKRDLPDFEEPPVTETSFGVEFTPLEGWSIPHYGLYWSRIRERFPDFEVQPPLVSGRDGQPGRGVVQFRIVAVPDVRCWFKNAKGTGLVQVQSDRFLVNWRKVDGSEPYPRYEYVRDQFRGEWAGFLEFLNDNHLPSPKAAQCELSYFNHLEQGRGWNTFADLPRVLAPWSGNTSTGFLPKPEAVLVNAVYPLPDEAGKLHVVMQPAIRHIDGKEILQLSLTARGNPRGNDMQAFLAWFALGREWIVRGFTDFTASEMHTIWGRKL